MRCEEGAESLQSIEYRSRRFARTFNAQTGLVWRGGPLQLGDVVGGGHGFGDGRMDYGIDPLTGDQRNVVVQGRTGEGTYVGVSENTFVDGVFVPDGTNGPIQVSSQGHKFMGCPATVNDLYVDIFTGSGRLVPGQRAPLILGAVEYGTGEHESLFMHANAGITFDLDAMRRFYPGVEIAGFRSVCGIPGGLKEREALYEYFGGADFWVLVDGEVRYSWRDAQLGEVREIAISLEEGDRFLTLVTTDGGDQAVWLDDPFRPMLQGTFLDWCTFGEPRLELRSTSATQRVEAAEGEEETGIACGVSVQG